MTVTELASHNGSGPARDMPVHDNAMEQAVLGSMMLQPAVLGECLEMLLPRPGSEVFLRGAHQIVFEAIVRLDERSEPVDPITVKTELERRKELNRAGGAPYLHTLIASVPVVASAPFYVRELLKLHRRRELKAAGLRIQQLADEGDAGADDLSDRAHEILDDATGLSVERTESESVADLLVPFLDQLGKGPDSTPALQTGWRDLDDLIGGFRPGQVVTVGGRPAMGKSVVILNIAAHVAVKLRKPVLFASLEMSKDECMERLVSHFSGVSLTAIRERTCTKDDWKKIERAYEELITATTLVINDNQDMTPHGVRAEVRAMKRAQMTPELVALDYIQLVEGGGGKFRSESRQVDVANFSRSFKKLGKEFGIPVLVGCQLNRGPDQRSDHRPMLSDFRESGALEQDSDIALLLYRDDAYEPESVRAGEIDVIVAKNRQGPKGTVPLAFRGHFAMCADLYREPV